MCRLPGWEEKTARAVNDMRAANGRRRRRQGSLIPPTFQKQKGLIIGGCAVLITDNDASIELAICNIDISMICFASWIVLICSVLSARL
jgi:hypothetical protein